MMANEIRELKEAEETLIKEATKDISGESILNMGAEELLLVRTILRFVRAADSLLIAQANTIDELNLKLDRLATKIEKS